jgi:hypothetical protein
VRGLLFACCVTRLRNVNGPATRHVFMPSRNAAALSAASPPHCTYTSSASQYMISGYAYASSIDLDTPTPLDL